MLQYSNLISQPKHQDKKTHLNSLKPTMIRRPDTADTRIDTGNRLIRALLLLPTRLLQQRRLLANLFRIHISHFEHLIFAVDVVAAENGMGVRTRRDADFDLRVGFCEGGEVFVEVFAGVMLVRS